MKKLDCCLLRISLEEKLLFNQTPQTRGFIASTFKEEILANRNNQKLRYAPGLVQYKIINGDLFIIGVDEGADLIYKIKDKMQYLCLGKTKNRIKITIIDKNFLIGHQWFGISDEMLSYQFLTPWVPLNQENFFQYNKASKEDKKRILKKILIGNILSLSKGFGYIVPKEIIIECLLLNFDLQEIKNKKMLMGLGVFKCNFILPQYWGIGRFSTRGYGTVTAKE